MHFSCIVASRSAVSFDTNTPTVSAELEIGLGVSFAWRFAFRERCFRLLRWLSTASSLKASHVVDDAMSPISPCVTSGWVQTVESTAVFGESVLTVVFGESVLIAVFGESVLFAVFGESVMTAVFGELA